MDARAELSRALLNCETLKTEEGRQRLILDLPDPISGGVGHSARPLMHMQNLVDRCAGFPGGLRTLIEALRAHEPGTRPFLKMIPLALGVELLEIVANEIDENDLTAFYLNSLPRFQPPRKAANTWEQIKLLWQMHSLSGESSPIVRFVDQIVESIGEPEATELRGWREWALEQSSLNLQEGSTAKASDHESVAHPFLTVVVKPLPSDGRTGGYQVTTYLWSNEKEVLKLESGARLIHPRQELPALVAEGLREAQQHLHHRMPDLIIEFCLPYELMSDEMDQFSKPDPQVGELCLGTLYPVVVRPFYRLMDDGEARGWWEARWRKVRRRIMEEISDEAQVWICPEDEQELDTFFGRLTERSRSICFLGLPFTPVGKMGERSNLTEMMRSGVPVALWPRLHHAQIEPPDIYAFLGELLSDERLAELPYHLQARRLHVHADRGHPGNHMTLLWDDADRIPPPFPGGARPFSPSAL